VLDRLGDDLKSTLVIITSKSGGTPETRNGMLEVKHRFEALGLDFPSHAVAITMIGSKMDELERLEGWLAEFPMFDWVGGRTSEMSAVGLLSASLLGIDIRSMLAGAKEMDAATRIPTSKTIRRPCWRSPGTMRATAKAKRIWLCCPAKTACYCFLAIYSSS